MKKIIVVGSGVGGATIAKALSESGAKVTVLEKGLNAKPLGSDAIVGYYENSFKNLSQGGVLIYRSFMRGGSGTVSCANGVRVLQEEFNALGIDLEDEFTTTEKELNVSPVPEAFIGERTSRIMKAANELGYSMQPMPKFIDFSKCVKCGKCILGCAPGAKWSPLMYLKEAQENGAEIIDGAEVLKVVHSQGKVAGVVVKTAEGEEELSADIVVLAAGAMATPVILQRSGISEAGKKFFVDMYVNVYGSIEDAEMQTEIPMAAHLSDFYKEKGFLMAPYLLPFADTVFMPPFVEQWRKTITKKTLGIMTKIRDTSIGRIHEDGTVEKRVEKEDQDKLSEGERLSKEILLKTGCDENTIFSSNVESAHPGGTAAIGEVVNNEFESGIKNLFVSDASLIPESPGAPPIITIIALSKKLGRILSDKKL